MEKFRGKVAALGAAVVVCVIGSLWATSPQETGQAVPLPPSGVTAVQKQGVQVYVSGAVAQPGLYTVAAGSRATAAIAAAGGMTSEANADKVNLAKLLKDGMQVNVPRLTAKQLREKVDAGAGAVDSGSAVGSAVPSSGSAHVGGLVAARTGTGAVPVEKTTGTVHLNAASARELTQLPGVGEVTAQRIVEYRQAHAFGSIEEIMEVKGIGQAKFAKMQPYLEL